MQALKTMAMILFLMASAAVAQEPSVTPLVSKDFTDPPGKEGLMITVEYPSGCSDPVIDIMRMASSTFSKAL